LRNTYNVTNLIDVWECDLLGVQSLAKYNDIQKYILSVMDVFSKYKHLVPVTTKTGPSIASEFCAYFTTTTRGAV
jgi:hypothetical protein